VFTYCAFFFISCPGAQSLPGLEWPPSYGPKESSDLLVCERIWPLDDISIHTMLCMRLHSRSFKTSGEELSTGPLACLSNQDIYAIFSALLTLQKFIHYKWSPFQCNMVSFCILVCICVCVHLPFLISLLSH
jgi:hypothetical protein